MCLNFCSEYLQIELWLTGYAKLSYVWMCVCTWCPMMDRHPIQDVFPPRAECSQDEIVTRIQRLWRCMDEYLKMTLTSDKLELSVASEWEGWHYALSLTLLSITATLANRGCLWVCERGQIERSSKYVTLPCDSVRKDAFGLLHVTWRKHVLLVSMWAPPHYDQIGF